MLLKEQTRLQSFGDIRQQLHRTSWVPPTLPTTLTNYRDEPEEAVWGKSKKLVLLR